MPSAIRFSLLLFTLLLFTLFLVACTTVDPHRSDYAAICQVDATPPDTAAEACRRATVERGTAFEIGYVELSDQGWFHSREQFKAVRERLHTSGSQDLQVVVFVHGWRHSADFEDQDVQAFRGKVLPAFAQARPGAKTVGVFVGWRGASLIDVGPLPLLSFYDRKSTADHVARGSIRELFAHLRTLRQAEQRAGGGRISVTVIGHSFGGLIVFNAMAESLLDALVRAGNGPDAERVAQPVVDLLLLLNPAFEATRFEPLFQAAKDGLDDGPAARPYGPTQRPLLVAITSAADAATRIAFPLGRTTNSIFQHEGWTDQDPPGAAPHGTPLEKIANTHTAGHMIRYRTHALRLDDNVASPSAAASDDTPGVVCLVEPGNARLGNRFPLWNMYADAAVIADHHDIYRPNLWQFILRLRDWPAGSSEPCRSPNT